ncbi:MAG: glycosyltransferase, partial [Pseudomonadota bacterium]
AWASISTFGSPSRSPPRAMMAAQAMGLPCLASNVSAIPELILSDETGILVESGDQQALTQAIATLAADPDKRARLAAAGSVRVRQEFGFSVGLDQLAGLFGLAPDEALQSDDRRLAS